MNVRFSQITEKYTGYVELASYYRPLVEKLPCVLCNLGNLKRTLVGESEDFDFLTFIHHDG